MSRRARERGDKRERWDFQPDWREERDNDDDELPERDDDDPPPANTFHISRYCSLPHRQLRKSSTKSKAAATCSLPHRQLRKVSGSI